MQFLLKRTKRLVQPQIASFQTKILKLYSKIKFSNKLERWFKYFTQGKSLSLKFHTGIPQMVRSFETITPIAPLVLSTSRIIRAASCRIAVASLIDPIFTLSSPILARVIATMISDSQKKELQTKNNVEKWKSVAAAGLYFALNHSKPNCRKSKWLQDYYPRRNKLSVIQLLRPFCKFCRRLWPFSLRKLYGDEFGENVAAQHLLSEAVLSGPTVSVLRL